MTIGRFTRAAAVLSAAAVLLTAVSACRAESGAPEAPKSPDTETPEENKDNEIMHTRIKITAGNAEFIAETDGTAAAEAFVKALPQTLEMSELNGNEKYFYLPFSLPAAQSRPGTIREGDIMLYGSSCIVIFYKTFTSSYSYTRIGRIADTAGLAAALGTGSVTVRFEAL